MESSGDDALLSGVADTFGPDDAEKSSEDEDGRLSKRRKLAEVPRLRSQSSDDAGTLLLPTTEIAHAGLQTDDDHALDDECPICLGALDKEHRYRLPSCGHTFHIMCMLQAFNHRRREGARCPLCRGTGVELSAHYLREKGEDSETRHAEQSVLAASFQLVSDSVAAATVPLAALTPSDMRSLETVLSDMGRKDCAARGSSESLHRRILGRKEVFDKIPKDFTLPAANFRHGQIRSRHVSRYVSRDALYIESLQDSHAFARFAGVSRGFHVKRASENFWCWVPDGEQVTIGSGDRVALLLESPRGSSKPAPSEDMASEKAACLLGLELSLPTEQ